MMRRSLALFAVLLAATHCPSATIEEAEAVAMRFGQMYFAPMNGGSFWRMYDPQNGMVEFRIKADGRHLMGAAGWSGMRDGEVVSIYAPATERHGRIEFTFRKGRPEVFSIDGTKYGVQVDDGEIKYHGDIPAMWDDDPAQDDNPLDSKWGGRFTLFYRNPNRFAAFATSFALIALAALLFCTGKARIIAAVATAVLVLGVVLSGSRGSELGFTVGALVIAAGWLMRRGIPKAKALSICGGAVVLITVAMALTGKLGAWFEDPGNTLRLNVWKIAPKMMVDAPNGWGEYATSATAYMDWYQPIESLDILWTLIGSHTTALVSMGWLGRVSWIFGWCMFIALFARSALRGSNPLPCAIWSALCIAAVFNPVLNDFGIWAPAVAALVWWAAMERPWGNPKNYSKVLVVGGIASAIITAGICIAGQTVKTDGMVPVNLNGKCVAVNGDNPDVWILDDGKCLGWQMAPKDIRFFCKSVTEAPAMGYSRDLGALPRAMRRLIVAGERCKEYVDAWISCNAPAAKEIVFISPGFGHELVPDGLRRQSAVFMVIGEFAARYSDVYGKGPFPDWVGVSPGAETYIPGWVSFTLAR